MKISISEVKSIPEYITIRRSEYVELKSKARRYDERRSKEQKRINNLNSKRTKEERSYYAQKAAQARWSKYERN